MELGKIYREVGERHNALLSFEKAKELKPNHLGARLQLASEQIYLDRLEESKQNLDVVFAIKPKNPHALIQLGTIYRKQENREKAMDCFQLALESEPTHFWANINLAVELQHAGLLVEAEQQLQTALKHYPNDSRILIRLGNLEKVRGDKQQALNWFNQAGDCSSNPNQLRDTKLAKIQVLLELNRLDEAVEDIEPILEQWPENLQVKLIFANLLKKQLDWSKAAELYREILLIEPENLNAKLQLAQTLREMGEAEEAIAILENLRHIFPDDLRVLLSLGHIYREQKDRLKAIECFKKALSVDPTHLRANLSLGLALKEAELFDEAEQQLQTALKHHPQNWEIFLKLGELEQKRHGLEDALGYFQQAREYHPDSFEPSLKIAQTLSNLNQLDGAETELNQLLEKYPDENRIIMQLAYLERQRGRREEALNWFRNC